MKNPIAFLLAALLIANANFANAEQKQLSEEDKARILSALEILRATGVIKQNENGRGVEIDNEIIDELQERGLLVIQPSSLHVVCVGRSPQ